jgi:tetratricopeptide (TPR) repeat protein
MANSRKRRISAVRNPLPDKLVNRRTFSWRVARVVVPLVFVLAALLGLGAFALSEEYGLFPTATPAGTAQATATAAAAIPSNLQTTLYNIEAEAAANGWSARLHRESAEVWTELGDETRALTHWEASVRAEPSATNLRNAASLHLKRGNWGAAFGYLSTLHDLAPENAWAAYQGGAMLAATAPTQAITWLEPLVADETTYQQAAEALLNVLRETESPVPLGARVGAVLASDEEWALAEYAFQLGAISDFIFPEAMAYVGVMRALQGKEGAPWLAQAVELAPDDANVRYAEGIYWRTLERYDQSVTALLSAIVLEPETAIFHAELGNTYRAMGSLTDAEAWLLSAITLSEGDPLYQAALERLYVEEAYLVPEPLLVLSRPSSSGQADPVALSAQGWALHRTGQTEEGLVQIQTALDADPDNPRARYDLARIYLDTGRTEEARPILEALAQEDHSFAPLAERLLEGMGE